MSTEWTGGGTQPRSSDMAFFNGIPHVTYLNTTPVAIGDAGPVYYAQPGGPPLAVGPRNEAGLQLGVDPNPARGEQTTVRFNLPTAGLVEWSLWDINGRRAATGNAGVLGNGPQRIGINSGGLRSGVYLLGVRSSSGWEGTGRIVVVR